MDRARDQFFPGPGFPIDKDRGIGGRYDFDLLEDEPQCLALTDDLFKLQLTADFVFEVQLLLGEFVLEVGNFAERHCVFYRDGHLAGNLGEEYNIILNERVSAQTAQAQNPYDSVTSRERP